ncbi:teneurin-1 isoform X1, partial [Tachysurus ichikawai]
HFLFKHGSGSSTLFNATNQNYPLTSSTVYSPPPRPLPRSPISRPLFSFSKPYRCCNWKCTALSAAAITVTLALLLTYVIGHAHFLSLPWACFARRSCKQRSLSQLPLTRRLQSEGLKLHLYSSSFTFCSSCENGKEL